MPDADIRLVRRAQAQVEIDPGPGGNSLQDYGISWQIPDIQERVGAIPNYEQYQLLP